MAQPLHVHIQPVQFQPTLYAKRQLARAWYHRGKSFVVSAFLLHSQGGNDYVFLHLFCQGIEIVLKSLLLMKDYDGYKPKMRQLGHNLEATAHEALATYGMKPLSPKETAELRELNVLYGRHLLRYGSMLDIFVDPATIKHQEIMRKMLAVLRYVDREMARTA